MQPFGHLLSKKPYWETTCWCWKKVNTTLNSKDAWEKGIAILLVNNMVLYWPIVFLAFKLAVWLVEMLCFVTDLRQMSHYRSTLQHLYIVQYWGWCDAYNTVACITISGFSMSFLLCTIRSSSWAALGFFPAPAMSRKKQVYIVFLLGNLFLK